MSMHIERHVERWASVAPGHLESHPVPIEEDEERLVACTHEESRRLQQQFLCVHGKPKGEVTTLSCGGARSSWQSDD